MNINPARTVDAWLWNRGVHIPEARRVLRRLVLTAALSVPSGLAILPLWNGLFWFGVCTALGAWNFYGLTIFVRHAIFTGWSGSILFRLLLGANGRLLITGCFLYLALVWCAAPVTALAAGVTVPVVFIVIEGCARIFRQRTGEKAASGEFEQNSSCRR